MNADEVPQSDEHSIKAGYRELILKLPSLKPYASEAIRFDTDCDVSGLTGKKRGRPTKEPRAADGTLTGPEALKRRAQIERWCPTCHTRIPDCARLDLIFCNQACRDNFQVMTARFNGEAAHTGQWAKTDGTWGRR